MPRPQKIEKSKVIPVDDSYTAEDIKVIARRFLDKGILDEAKNRLFEIQINNSQPSIEDSAPESAQPQTAAITYANAVTAIASASVPANTVPDGMSWNAINSQIDGMLVAIEYCKDPEMVQAMKNQGIFIPWNSVNGMNEKTKKKLDELKKIGVRITLYTRLSEATMITEEY